MRFRDNQRLSIRHGIAVILALSTQVVVADTELSNQATSSRPTPSMSDQAPNFKPPINTPQPFVQPQETEALESSQHFDNQTEQPTDNTENNAVQQIFHERRMAVRQAQMERERQRNMAALRKRWEARRARLNARYQRMRRRAAAEGVQLADIPPWDEAGTSNSPTVDHTQVPRSHESVAESTMPEDRDRDRDRDMSHPPVSAVPDMPNARPRRQNFGNQPYLERMQAIIDGMTPEERDACTTVHRLSMGLMQHSRPYMQPPMPPVYHNAPRGYGTHRQGAGYDYYPNGPTGYSPYSSRHNSQGYERGIKYQAPDWRGEW